MTAAFAVNLRALGLLSLLVGLFLIYNAMMFLVLQRRSLIGCLRALGVTRREIFRLVISEALGLATIGTVLGIAAGTVIGRLLLSSVSETISTVYFPLGPSALIVEMPKLINALLLGIGASVLAVLAPVYEATSLIQPAALRWRSFSRSSSTSSREPHLRHR